jgi:hypothetical protein
MNTCAPAFIALTAYSAWVFGHELIDTASGRVAASAVSKSHDAHDLETRIAMIGARMGFAHVAQPHHQDAHPVGHPALPNQVM